MLCNSILFVELYIKLHATFALLKMNKVLMLKDLSHKNTSIEMEKNNEYKNYQHLAISHILELTH